MGFFTNKPEEEDEFRGVAEADLPKLNDLEIIMLALARIYAAEGLDSAFAEEMRKRGQRRLGENP